jgi:hypothetical protein
MKKLGVLSVVCSVLLIGLLDSCVSLQDRTLSPEEMQRVEVVGTVETDYLAFHFLHIQAKGSKKEYAYKKLLEVAKEKYANTVDTNKIDIKNIEIKGTFSGLDVPLIIIPQGIMVMDFQKIHAKGDVILTGDRAKNTLNAIEKTSAALINRLPENAVIAVLNVFSSDRDTSEHIIGELEYNLVNSGKFKIVDRRRLDQIRNEQSFQISGEVNDNSAVSIGNMLGATIVITGEITGTGSSQRLIIKALDVKTAQIITMAREQF